MNANLNPVFNEVVSYLIGYFIGDTFWTSGEALTLEEAKVKLEKQKLPPGIPQTRKYIIIEKTISYKTIEE